MHEKVKKPIKTYLNVALGAVSTNALRTGVSIYKSKYALINQFNFVAKKHPAIPLIDNSLVPMISVMIYNPVRKNKD